MMELPDFYLGVGLFTSIILLALGHYFPLPKRELHPLIRYACGNGIILVGLFVWLVLGLGQWKIFLALCAFNLVGGVTVSLCYGYDAIMGQGPRDYIIKRQVGRGDGEQGRTNE